MEFVYCDFALYCTYNKITNHRKFNHDAIQPGKFSHRKHTKSAKSVEPFSKEDLSYMRQLIRIYIEVQNKTVDYTNEQPTSFPQMGLQEIVKFPPCLIQFASQNISPYLLVKRYHL